MLIAIQWIDCGHNIWESSEGRFVIYPHPDGAYVRDRTPQHPAPEDMPYQTTIGEGEVFDSVDQAKRWAHQRLEHYWGSEQ